MHESYSDTGAYYIRQNSQFTLHFSYSIYDAHLPERASVIFGFEQSSFDYENKPILTSLVRKVMVTEKCCTGFIHIVVVPITSALCPPSSGYSKAEHTAAPLRQLYFSRGKFWSSMRDGRGERA